MNTILSATLSQPWIITRFALAFGIVAIIALSAKALILLKGTQIKTEAALKQMHIIEKLYLDRRNTLYLVKINGTKMLVGSSPDGITFSNAQVNNRESTGGS